MAEEKPPTTRSERGSVKWYYETLEVHAWHINREHRVVTQNIADAVRSTRIAILHQLDAGRRLRDARNTLKSLQRKVKKENRRLEGVKQRSLDPEERLPDPPTWDEWLAKNCPDISKRTDRIYRQLVKGQDKWKEDFELELNDADVSQRKLLKMLRVLEATEKGADDQEKTAAKTPEKKGEGEDPPPDFDPAYEDARYAVLKLFRETVSKWPRSYILLLSEHEYEFLAFLERFRRELAPLVRAYQSGFEAERLAEEPQPQEEEEYDEEEQPV
jgi:hypothetical protein